VELAPLDLAIVGVFVLAVLGLGLSARAGKSPLEFLAAGRALTLPAFVATLVATWYGGILGVGESVAFYGIGAWLLIGVPYYVFGVLYAVWLAPRVRQADQISIPERMRAVFGPAAGLVAAALLFLLAVPSAHVLMLGTLVQAFTGWPLALAVAAGTASGAVFILKGGLVADVRVSLLAFVAMYVGFAAALVLCAQRLPLGDLIAGLPPEQRSITGGQNWPTVLTFFILGAWTLADPGFHQRVAATASPEVGRRGVLVAVACWVVFDLLSVTTSLYALRLLAPPENSLLLFPQLASEILPPGWRGLFLVGIAGTVLSAAVGYALVAGASFGREIVARNRPDGEVTATRLGIAVGHSWAGLIIGAILIPTLLAYTSRRTWSNRLVAASMIAATAVSGAWMTYGLANGNAFLMVDWGFGAFSLGTLLPGLAVSGVILLIGNALRSRTT
jgi:solute:Na+ symporter, SSS family